MHQTFVNSDNLNQVLNSVYQLIQNSASSSALSALSSSKTYARGLVYDYTVTNVGFIIDEDNNNILASLEWYNTDTGELQSASQALPIANETQPGIVPKEDIQELRRLAEVIGAMEGVVTYLNGKNFETANLATLQTLMTNEALLQGYTQPLPNSLIINNWYNGHEYIYNSETLEWVDYGPTVAAIGTIAAAGLVKGSTEAGKIYIETDGTGSLIGYAALVAGIGNNATAITNLLNASTGHDHDGTDSKKISYENILNTPNSISGNAGTATKLATARTIATSGGATGTATSFDGSINITIPITELNASKLSGAIPSAVTATTQNAGTNTTALATTAFVKTAIDNKTSITGNAGTATKLATARTIATSGGATGTATSFDGSINITIPITELNASKLSGAIPSAVTAATQAATDNSTKLATTAFVTTAVANKTTITGNAGTATTLQNARTIATSGGATGTATSFNGSINITIPITALNASYLSGAIPSAVTATTQASTDNSAKLATTAYVKSVAPASRIYKTAWATLPSSGTNTITHSLALTSTELDNCMAWFDLKCVTATKGYAVGDIAQGVIPIFEGNMRAGTSGIIVRINTFVFYYSGNFLACSIDSNDIFNTGEQSNKFQYRIRLFY